MKVTAYVSHSDCSRHDTGWGHPEHQGRLPAVARAVYRDMLTLFEPLLEREAEPADEAALRLAHSAGHVARVREAARAAEAAGAPQVLEGETVVSGASWEAALAAVGAGLTAVEAVLAGEVRNAFCPVRPPGHGAGVDRPGGFCLFNNVAIAARHLRERHGLDRVLLVEWSARPGTGTAEIVAGDPGVRFLSVHQETPAASGGWPAAARRTALPAGTAGAEFTEAALELLEGALSDFHPDFLLLSVGFDALRSDPLGGLALGPDDFHPLTRSLRERADALCGGRLVSLMEGGYDPAATGQAVVQHLRALAGLPAV